MFASIHAAAVIGIHAVPVDVELDLGAGLQTFNIAGLPDGAVRESRVRVRAALENAGYTWPTRRVSLNLAPADIRKDGAAFDLPIAMAVLAATGDIGDAAMERLEQYLVAGELSLDGFMRPVRGVLSMAMCARENGQRGIIVPLDNAAEASVVEGLEVVPCRVLRDAVDFARTGRVAHPFERADVQRMLEERTYHFDFGDVSAQHEAKRALEVAAAGGHNVLLVGPPGSGKTMLSKRLLTILPKLEFEEALETTRVYSSVGLVDGTGLVTVRPFRAPHHTISDVGLVGGGSGTPRPGEISLAHHGILFLDELPEFRRSVLEVMRQPLEDGHVSISRSLVTVTYPAQITLVASMNPCPCGYLTHPSIACVCPQHQVDSYRGRISGPLMDRIDLHVDVPAVPYEALRRVGNEERSEAIRGRVEAARAVQRARFAGDAGVHCNAQMDARLIREHCVIDEAGHRLLERVVDQLGISARAWGRILKVARTIADLDGSEAIEARHVAESVGYRKMDRQRNG